MDSDSHVETFSTDSSLHVFVTGDSRGLEGFGGNLLLFEANQMDATCELVELGSLFTDIIDSNFWVWDTSIESRFWIWFIFLVPHAPCWSSSHYSKKIIMTKLIKIVFLNQSKNTWKKMTRSLNFIINCILTKATLNFKVS